LSWTEWGELEKGVKQWKVGVFLIQCVMKLWLLDVVWGDQLGRGPFVNCCCCTISLWFLL
jgi:hypothetical protein